MKCQKCGKDYPSKHYFKTDSICEECYNKMSSEEKRSAEETDLKAAKHLAGAFEIKGHPLKCPICGNDKFWTRQTLMNTPGLTFLGVEWANKQADNFVCNRCGHILWFFREQ
jgi:DNA-directed RNA polymerase subunit M/transcription elongation factor TFIIS